MAAEKRDRQPALIEADIRRLLARQLSDEDLRAGLEALARQWAFSGFTWLYGPELYRRNRVLFRPFLLANFGTTQMTKLWSWSVVAWKGAVGESLERWLAEVDQRDDVELFRRLYEWKLAGLSRETRAERIRSDLLRRFEGAPTPAARGVILGKFNLSLELNETTALRLYALDPAQTGPFILQHLPSRWGWSGEERTLWAQFFQAALPRDRALAMRLYRRQVPMKRWEADALALCLTTPDSAELCSQLHDHHPEGWGLELGDRVYRLVEARGRDVVPYVLRHLTDIWPRFWGRGGYGKLLNLARSKEWWDLWSGLLRVSASAEDWNSEIRRLVADRSLTETEVVRRLLLLTGVAREWNFGGFSAAQVHQLDDRTADELYQRFPSLVRGPFKLHLQSGYWSVLPRLIRRVLDEGDEPLIDLLASRLVTRAQNQWGGSEQMKQAEALASYFERLRDADPREFARRAANVLTQVPAYSFYGYDQAIRSNRLARLLLERSLPSFLDDPAGLRDLIEASEIHVQHLAYRVLALDDERACRAASESLDIVIGTLLRPLQRRTRLAAFAALANAGRVSLADARRILARAREAIALPDRKYPKEELVGLIAGLLRRWPELRGPREAATLFRSKELAR